MSNTIKLAFFAVLCAVKSQCLIASSQHYSGDSVSQIKTSTSFSSSRSKVMKAFALPAVFVATGFYMLHDDEDSDDKISKYKIRRDRNNRFPLFHTHIDDYLQYAPIAAVYGLNIAGVKGETDFANRTAILIKSEIIMAVITCSLKKITAEPRPDSGKPNSFPSGHTAQAFAAATFMAREYKGKSIWYPIAAYSVATSVGVMRVLNDRHWANDVLAGAGVGIISTNLAYLTHRYKWGKRKGKPSGITAFPTYSNGPGLYFSCRL